MRLYGPDSLREKNDGAGFAQSYSAQYGEVFRNNLVGQRCVPLIAGLIGGLAALCAGGDAAAKALVERDGLLEKFGPRCADLA